VSAPQPAAVPGGPGTCHNATVEAAHRDRVINYPRALGEARRAFSLPLLVSAFRASSWRVVAFLPGGDGGSANRLNIATHTACASPCRSSDLRHRPRRDGFLLWLAQETPRKQARCPGSWIFTVARRSAALARLKPWTEECFDVRPRADPRRKRCYDSGGRRRDGQQ
jgi:hypothetical protein